MIMSLKSSHLLYTFKLHPLKTVACFDSRYEAFKWILSTEICRCLSSNNFLRSRRFSSTIKNPDSDLLQVKESDHAESKETRECIQDSHGSDFNELLMETKHLKSSQKILKEDVNDKSSEKTSENVLLKGRYGQLMNSLLHKTYLNLEERKLVPSLLQDDLKCGKRKRTQDNHLSLREQTVRHPAKDLFAYKMCLKYQMPTLKEAKLFMLCHPDPEKLFNEVMQPIAEAGGTSLPRPVITGHLGNRYWKAHLELSWPRKLSVKGLHPDRALAVKGAYWLMCSQLQKFGLISINEERMWQPMTCDKVVSMLDTLVKYGESCLGNSKGRGFKIILERAKEEERRTETVLDGTKHSNLEVELCNEKQCMKRTNEIHYTENTAKESQQRIHEEYGKISVSTCSVEDLPKKFIDQSKVQSVERTCSSVLPVTFDVDEEISKNSGESATCVDSMDDTTSSHRKPQWICTVHVGWPYPFTVQTRGLSLPSAQMLGYMAVVSKFKTLSLLTRCNNQLFAGGLEKKLLLETKKHFERSIEMLWDKRAIEKFDADAEMVSDASLSGFGAYLLLKDVKKVSWMCETWDEHGQTYLLPTKLHLQSVLAELFAIVTAIFSWKHKLRSRKLLCINDNKAVIGLINSFDLNPIHPETCINPYDHLIHTLQSTCVQYNIEVQATWLDRDQITLADDLSKQKVSAFRSGIPEATVNKTKAKKLRIKEGIYEAGTVRN